MDIQAFMFLAAFALAGCAALGYEVYCLRIKVRNLREELIISSERNGALATAAKEAVQILHAANVRHTEFAKSVQAKLADVRVELTNLAVNGAKLHAIAQLYAKTCSYWPGYTTLIKAAGAQTGADPAIIEMAIVAAGEVCDEQQN